MNILENIRSHKDLISLTPKQRVQLCEEIRAFLVENVSKTGGHMASNLGVVELTVAIETVFDTATDRLVFDVGHQSYVHKMLTGRQADFATLRQFGGMAGFPKPSESDTDAFVAGHASCSVSVALGMARARSMQNENYNVVALIGDGSATGGVAYEGLNDAAVSNEPMVIILNDNALSIDHNVGGMAYHLRQLRTKRRYLVMKRRTKNFLSKIPGGKWLFKVLSSVRDTARSMLLPATIFESMGFTYLGPVDGHNTEKLIMLLQMAKDMQRPVVLHIMTQKGRGYMPAEDKPMQFHGVGKFDPETGKPIAAPTPGFSDAFGQKLLELSEENDRICAITAAMPSGTGLRPYKEKYPQRLFDVGIAEEHAVAMAGGLAKQGMIPVVALYSTFLQRAYDMLLQDICMLNLHTVIAVDRAGLVGEDGETHHGVYDVGFLRHAPGMTLLAPASCLELQDMLTWAIKEQTGPVAIRYPRGGDREYKDSAWMASKADGFFCHRKGGSAVLITYGVLLDNVMQAAEILSQKGIKVTVLRLLRLTDLAVDRIAEYLPEHSDVFVFEEVNTNCGISRELALYLQASEKTRGFYVTDLGNDFVTHGSIQKLYEMYGLDAQSIVTRVEEVHLSEN